jgi:hypothetical protein
MTYARALQQATIGADQCGRSYIYRLTTGAYYVSEFPPAMINATYTATVTRTPTGALVINGGPATDAP